MSTQHTKGPWRLLPEECDKPYIRIRGTQLGGRYKIANVLTPIHPGVHEDEADETRANARLISEAPDLLEALREAEAGLEFAGADKLTEVGGFAPAPLAALRIVRAAIAKATGETK